MGSNYSCNKIREFATHKESIKMGFGFHSMPVIKANRALLKKRRTFKDIRAEYENLTSKTELKIKELTPFQQKVK